MRTLMLSHDVAIAAFSAAACFAAASASAAAFLAARFAAAFAAAADCNLPSARMLVFRCGRSSDDFTHLRLRFAV
eukprot:SAG31_NODE_4276_length_3386_cov_1.703681_7_plen_75_part_00